MVIPSANLDPVIRLGERVLFHASEESTSYYVFFARTLRHLCICQLAIQWGERIDLESQFNWLNKFKEERMAEVQDLVLAIQDLG